MKIFLLPLLLTIQESWGHQDLIKDIGLLSKEQGLFQGEDSILFDQQQELEDARNSRSPRNSDNTKSKGSKRKG